VSLGQSRPGCAFVPVLPLRLSEAAEVALEDYARVQARAAQAEAVRDTPDGPLLGVHLCGAPEAPSDAVRREVADFARSLEGQP
jgi:hypothetical protein